MNDEQKKIPVLDISHIPIVRIVGGSGSFKTHYITPEMIKELLKRREGTGIVMLSIGQEKLREQAAEQAKDEDAANWVTLGGEEPKESLDKRRQDEPGGDEPCQQ